MTESFSVDPSQLRRIAPKFATIADQAATAIEQLKADLAQEGECWGDDGLGRAFAETYRPDARKAMNGLENAMDNVRQEGNALSGLATTFEQQDQDAAAYLRNAADTGETALAQPTARQPGSGMRSAPPGPPGTPGTPTADSAPSPPPHRSTARPSEPAPAAHGVPARDPSTPAARGVPAGNPSNPATAQPAGEIRPQIEKPTTPGDVGPGATAGAPGVAAAPPAGAEPGRRRESPPSGGGRRQTRAFQQRGSAVSRLDGGPADRSSSAPPPGNRADAGRAPVSAPRIAPSDPRPAAPSSRRAAEPKRAGGQDPAPADVAGRIARELAGRFGIEVLGFALPGVHETVLHEIAAALADVLPKYPAIDLRRIAIADLPGRVAVTGWDWVPTPTGTRRRATWIAFDVEAARNPGTLADTLRAAADSGYLVRGCDLRPAYSTIVRELGRALDVAGGFGARRRAQSALIAHFLGGTAAARRTQPLGRIVRAYTEWRAHLPMCCFPGGRFDPAAALAEAFTDVQLHTATGPQAAVLHKLLVDSANGPAR